MNTRELRKASAVIFLVTDEVVATKISEMLLWAADTIDALRKNTASEPDDASDREPASAYSGSGE